MWTEYGLWLNEPVEMTHNGKLSCWSHHHSLSTAVLNVRRRLPSTALKYQPTHDISHTLHIKYTIKHLTNNNNNKLIEYISLQISAYSCAVFRTPVSALQFSCLSVPAWFNVVFILIRQIKINEMNKWMNNNNNNNNNNNMQLESEWLCNDRWFYFWWHTTYKCFNHNNFRLIHTFFLLSDY